MSESVAALEKQLDRIQAVLDEEAMLKKEVSDAKKMQDDLSDKIKCYAFDFPHKWVYVLWVVLFLIGAVKCFSVRNSIVQQSDWIRYGLSFVVTLLIFGYLLWWLCCSFSEVASEMTKHNQKKTQKEAKSYYAVEIAESNAILRRAERRLNEFQNSPEFQTAKELLPEKLFDAEELSRFILFVKAREFNSLEIALSDYLCEPKNTTTLT